jgi:hypothetical protein
MFNLFHMAAYSYIILFIQSIFSIYILTTNINYISYIIGFTICLLDFPKCILMKQYKCISDTTISYGSDIVKYDFICNFICLFSHTHLLFNYDVPRTIIFLIMAFPHMFNIQITDDKYIKNLNITISVMIYYIVEYFNINKVLFFIIIMNILEL